MTNFLPRPERARPGWRWPVAMVLLAVSGVVGVACAPEAAAPPRRTIEIAMRDHAFEPEALQVAAGEFVVLLFDNQGTTTHEAVLGTEAEQVDHRTEMAAAEGSHADHMHPASDRFAVVVPAGEKLRVEHRFKEADELVVGCHQPGHWEAGMRLDLVVTEAAPVAA